MRGTNGSSFDLFREEHDRRGRARELAFLFVLSNILKVLAGMLALERLGQDERLAELGEDILVHLKVVAVGVSSGGLIVVVGVVVMLDKAVGPVVRVGIVKLFFLL